MTAAPQDTVCIMPPERERVILAFGDEVRIRADDDPMSLARVIESRRIGGAR